MLLIYLPINVLRQLSPVFSLDAVVDTSIVLAIRSTLLSDHSKSSAEGVVLYASPSIVRCLKDLVGLR